MTGSLFGTDGIRGPFGRPPLDEDTVRRLGAALAQHLRAGAERPRVLVAGDTRHSTETIADWLAGGLRARGCAVLYGGVLPTPAVAHLVAARRCAAGIAVSASHNPLPDNGIKLFNAAGDKWAPEDEVRLEASLREIALPPDDGDGPPQVEKELADQYLDHLAALWPRGLTLAGGTVVLDTANGAASALAGPLFERLGATVATLADSPDGFNINEECGSTTPDAMSRAVVVAEAELGFAFDGDADRVIAADEKGLIRDGDAILYLLGRSLQQRGRLRPPRLVATSMSNVGLELALARIGIEVLRCDVGDRQVVRTLRRHGLLLGGEQSGHIVRLDLAPTGDGLQTALLVAHAVADAGQPLSEILGDFHPLPQVLHNVPVPRKPDLATLPNVVATARSVTEELGADGRLVLRYSGTEQLARVMIEGTDLARIETLARRLEAAIRRDIGEEVTT